MRLAGFELAKASVVVVQIQQGLLKSFTLMSDQSDKPLAGTPTQTKLERNQTMKKLCHLQGDSLREISA